MAGYYDYYYKKKPAIRVNGIKLQSKKGTIGSTWWSDRWIKALESMGLSSRLNRGRNYARQGQVLSIAIKNGSVAAKVQGSRPKPYLISIGLKKLTPEEWKRVLKVMASRAIFAAKLLTGEMPQGVEEIFNEADLNLFPKVVNDLHTDCSCPDWGNPCKHIAAVYYILAERFDQNPFLLMELRGMEKGSMLERLRLERVGKAKPSTIKIEKPAKERDFFHIDPRIGAFEIKPYPDPSKSALKLIEASKLDLDPKMLAGLRTAYSTIRGEALKRLEENKREEC